MQIPLLSDDDINLILMGNRKNKLEFIHFRNYIIIGISITFLMFSYVVIADSSNAHYVEVDQDIWSFLKYVGVIFLGVLSWIGIQLVLSMKSLVKNVGDLNLTANLTQLEVKTIKDDVSEIKGSINEHDRQIRALERVR